MTTSEDQNILLDGTCGPGLILLHSNVLQVFINVNSFVKNKHLENQVIKGYLKEIERDILKIMLSGPEGVKGVQGGLQWVSYQRG